MRPIQKPRHRWEDNIKMHLKELKNWAGGYGLDSFDA
jgi:hypothetical protein